MHEKALVYVAVRHVEWDDYMNQWEVHEHPEDYFALFYVPSQMPIEEFFAQPHIVDLLQIDGTLGKEAQDIVNPLPKSERPIGAKKQKGRPVLRPFSLSSSQPAQYTRDKPKERSHQLLESVAMDWALNERYITINIVK